MGVKGQFDTIESRTNEAHAAFHAARKDGTVSMIDGPQGYDKHGTVAAVVIGLKDGTVVRCALTRDETLNLARALLSEVS